LRAIVELGGARAELPRAALVVPPLFVRAPAASEKRFSRRQV
jgi:hypothetical protein